MYKTKISSIALLLLIIFLTQTVRSQTDSTQFKKWSVSMMIGLFMARDNDEFKISPNSGIDVEYHYTPSLAVYTNVGFNFLKNINTHYEFYFNTTSILEATMGARIYLDPELDRTFMELGFGYYQKFNQYRVQSYNTGNNNDEFGINWGFGSDIKVNSSIRIPIKVRFHFVNFLDEGDYTIYWGIYSGIKYSF